MTNDAKLGLVGGLILVIAVAVGFFRSDLVLDKPVEGKGEVAGAAPAPVPPAHAAPPPAGAPIAGAPMPPVGAPLAGAATPAAAPTTAMRVGRNHVVKNGESFFSLAQQYYGDGKKYGEIYRVNRRVTANPDYVAPGTVIFIPELPKP